VLRFVAVYLLFDRCFRICCHCVVFLVSRLIKNYYYKS